MSIPNAALKSLYTYYITILLFDCSRETNQAGMHGPVMLPPFLEGFSGVIDIMMTWNGDSSAIQAQQRIPSVCWGQGELCGGRGVPALPAECQPAAAGILLQAVERLSLTETIPWMRDYFWMYSAILTKPVILTILNSLLQILAQERSYFSTDVSMQESYFFAKSLSKNGFASITSMQIINRKFCSQFGFKPFYEIQACSRKISWNPKQTLVHKGIYLATKISYVIPF